MQNKCTSDTGERLSPQWSPVMGKEANQIAGGIWGLVLAAACGLYVAWGYFTQNTVKCTFLEHKW